MAQVVIENPVINSPYEEPACHFRFSDEGITNEVVTGRRTSSYFVPIARPKRRANNSSSRPSGPKTASRKTASSIRSGRG